MILESHNYAVLAVTHERRPIFEEDHNAELVIATLARLRDHGEFALHAFVVMPDHLLVVITPTESVQRAVQLLKQGLSFQLGELFPGEIWQPGYHEHRIRDAEDFLKQSAYIASSPMRRNLRDWPHVHTAHPLLIDPWLPSNPPEPTPVVQRTYQRHPSAS